MKCAKAHKLGPEVLLSSVDEDLRVWNWRCDKDGYLHRYFYTQGTYKNIRLHRIILGRKVGRALDRWDLCDHINHNLQDNRRENLRVVTNAQNMRNRGRLPCNNTSGYRGVSFDKVRACWRADLEICGVHKYIGRYETKEEAHVAYVMAAEKMFGKEFMGVVK
jgi:hypothetical protein